MRYIAMISVVGIIVIGVIIGLLIQRLKNRQAEELRIERERLTLANRQLKAARETLTTIAGIQGDSSFDAQMALDEINKLREEYYDNLGKGITR